MYALYGMYMDNEIPLFSCMYIYIYMKRPSPLIDFTILLYLVGGFCRVVHIHNYLIRPEYVCMYMYSTRNLFSSFTCKV